ncbi:MAG: hypothetical protein KKA99_04475 [Gammaproteobacteria bacterium]|nr:hypothetical protein [Gammaproteobacteria bacterium]MBU2546755.1 hypothetical protein [Gammaproteobacteria bacterium]
MLSSVRHGPNGSRIVYGGVHVEPQVNVLPSGSSQHQSTMNSAFSGNSVDSGTIKEVRTRSTLGRDGGLSEIIIERDYSGKAISRTHRVTVESEIVHQHQDHIGDYGERRFPDEWTGTKTINTPDMENTYGNFYKRRNS